MYKHIVVFTRLPSGYRVSGGYWQLLRLRHRITQMCVVSRSLVQPSGCMIDNHDSLGYREHIFNQCYHLLGHRMGACVPIYERTLTHPSDLLSYLRRVDDVLFPRFYHPPFTKLCFFYYAYLDKDA